MAYSDGNTHYIRSTFYNLHLFYWNFNHVMTHICLSPVIVKTCIVRDTSKYYINNLKKQILGLVPLMHLTALHSLHFLLEIQKKKLYHVVSFCNITNTKGYKKKKLQTKIALKSRPLTIFHLFEICYARLTN